VVISIQKNNIVEVSVFPPMGYGPWVSTYEAIFKGGQWAKAPWEIVSVEYLQRHDPSMASQLPGKGEKVFCGDKLLGTQTYCGSSTDLAQFETAGFDLVITDPSFGGNVQYAELSDFFYVWLRLVLKEKYPEQFSQEYTPKLLEVVANPFREHDNPDAFYQRLLATCWQEAHRILKPGGILAFTFHHEDDNTWIAVLESLFQAGFYLVATYPVRSDETKGENASFGSKKIEYDIIHVCRKRIEKSDPVNTPRIENARLVKAILQVSNLDAV
jgi:adenine-specific DNA methylase